MRTFLALAIFGLCFSLSAQSDILDVRTNYNIGQTVTIIGIVTSGADLGSVRYIQDSSAGIALYPGNDWSAWSAEPNPGDEVTVTGEITEYNGLLEIGPNLTQVDVLSSGNALPEAQVVTPNQLNESLEGELVVIQSTTFDAGGQTIESNTTYTFNASGEEGIIYVRSSNSLVGTVLNGCEMNLMGIVSQFTFDGFGGYQLLPRGASDMVSTSGICLTSEVEQTNISSSSFDLSWTTDVSGDSEVEWGLTPDLGTTDSDVLPVTDHVVSLSGLSPGTLYYARVKSTSAEGETVTSPTRVYATISESSGNIHVYFTGAVDTSVAIDEEAMSLGTSTNDTIAAWITSAQHTLDIAVYNTNNVAIENAVNTAAANGVQIRYIAEGENANLGIQNFDSSIPVHYRTDGEGAGMHNKFFIGDADYPETAFVLTGSTNMTTANLNTDKNNVIVFQDQSIARGYRLEFNEMWGSDTMVPDESNAKFGPAKTVNTPLKYIVGGSPVEVYFSPTDGTTSAIRETIETMDYDMAFALLSFTRDDLADAIIDGSSFFVSPQGAIEQISGTGAEFDNLTAAGIDVHSHQGIAGSLHHKYAVIDYSEPLSDPTVVTGSHNWSSTAENINDENTVIVHDARVSNLYYQEFRGLLISMGVISSIEQILGCTTPFACNYAPQATQDDGSCIFICNGCTDAVACNYDPSANVDDSSCDYLSCTGCTDAAACNFNLESTIDDGSCLYPEQYYDCFGGCINDSDGDGLCDELEIPGCTDEGSCNFNLEATDDDGSCEYETCAGCQYEVACNYDSEATIADNESCEYGTCPGCTDSTACNYNPTVSEDDGSCTIDDNCGVCGGDNSLCAGCMDISACNYDDEATFDDGINCVFALEYFDCDGTCLDSDLDGICDMFELLVINEIDAITTGIPQFIELYGTPGLSLDGYSLALIKSIFLGGGAYGAEIYDAISLEGQTLDLEGFWSLELELITTIAAVAIYEVGVNMLVVGEAPPTDDIVDAIVYGNTSPSHPQAAIIIQAIMPMGSGLLYEGTEENATGHSLSRLPDGGEPFGLESYSLQIPTKGVTNVLSCAGGVLDECGVCGGDGIPEGDCDCYGNILDECGVCGGLGIPEGDCDCEGNILDASGICGGDCEYDFNSNGVCDGQEVYGCTYPDSPSYDASATADDGSCVFYIIDNFCPADLDFNGSVGSPDLLLFLSAYGDVCE